MHDELTRLIREAVTQRDNPFVWRELRRVTQRMGMEMFAVIGAGCAPCEPFGFDGRIYGDADEIVYEGRVICANLVQLNSMLKRYRYISLQFGAIFPVIDLRAMEFIEEGDTALPRHVAPGLVTLHVNGVRCREGREFDVDGERLLWNSDEAGFNLEETDSIELSYNTGGIETVDQIGLDRFDQ